MSGGQAYQAAIGTVQRFPSMSIPNKTGKHWREKDLVCRITHADATHKSKRYSGGSQKALFHTANDAISFNSILSGLVKITDEGSMIRQNAGSGTSKRIIAVHFCFFYINPQFIMRSHYGHGFDSAVTAALDLPGGIFRYPFYTYHINLIRIFWLSSSNYRSFVFLPCQQISCAKLTDG